MIVVDASALVAIADKEADAGAFLAAISANPSVIAAINAVEAGIVLTARGRFRDSEEFAAWLEDLRVEIRSSGEVLDALTAYLTFGRGFHRARLNLADCFAYALAKSLDAPLLYKGDDFALTDIRSALEAA